MGSIFQGVTYWQIPHPQNLPVRAKGHESPIEWLGWNHSRIPIWAGALAPLLVSWN